jgi:integrase/recombinase XerC
VKVGVVQQFLAWATAEGHLARDPGLAIRRGRAPKGPPRVIADADISKVLTVASFRGKVMTIVALQLGLRVAEIAGLRVEDLAPLDDLPHGYADVLGKGNKRRVLPIPAQAAHVLDRWLRDDRTAGPLFPSQVGGGRKHMRPHSVSKFLSQVAADAGAYYRPHDLRHTFAVKFLERGGDLKALQELMGHSSLATTEVYLSARPARLRQFIEGEWYGPTAA